MKNPVVYITMENNDFIKAELYPKIAPNTVCHFISLINKGFYNGLLFHKIVKGSLLQGGCPYGTGMGNPGYAIKGEFSKNGFNNPLKHTKGILSLARATGYNSAGSQFFIILNTISKFDGAYAAFGKIIEGFDAIEIIANTPVDFAYRPLKQQRMASVSVETFGENYPEPEKVYDCVSEESLRKIYFSSII